MTKHLDLAKGQALPEHVLDALMELLGVLASNFLVEKASATSIRVPAGPGNDQATIAIQGKWRFNTANVTAAHPGGAQGTYDMYVTASDNDFSGTPPNVDLTNYTFALAIRAQGSPPTTALYRKVGTLEWSGSEITKINQTVGDLVGSPSTQGGIYVTQIGDGTSLTYDVTHALNSKNLIVEVRETTSPFSVVHPEIRFISDTQARIVFDSPPAAGGYMVVIFSGQNIAPTVGGVGTFTASVGDGVAREFTVTHNLGTKDAHVTVRRVASPFDEVEADVEFTTQNAITVRFSQPPSAGQYAVFVSTAQNREGAASVHASGHAPGGSDPLGQATVGLAGRVNADGTIAGGAGFTVTKNGVGDYTVNFTAAFASIPVVNATPVVGSAVSATAVIRAVAVGSVQLLLFNAAGAATDLPFHFDARPVS